MASRIAAYLAAVADAKRAEDADEISAALNASAQAYNQLTRQDCADLWYPGCPEAKDKSRRP
jgi:hypothetical protein